MIGVEVKGTDDILREHEESLDINMPIEGDISYASLMGHIQGA